MKYMGSKSRFSKYIIPIITKDMGENDYIEPFAGGMNLICNINHPKRYAYDSNPFLIAMWKALLDGWIPPKFISREYYDECKQFKHPNYIVGYVGFNCSYSGKWFGGYAGRVKTKDGMRDYQDEAFRNIMNQVPKMNNVVLECKSYDQIDVSKNSHIYCDPPYMNTTSYKDRFDHSKFWDWCRVVSKTNKVFISEYSAPEDFICIWQNKTNSSLSANGKSGGSKSSIERLFIHESRVSMDTQVRRLF